MASKSFATENLITHIPRKVHTHLNPRLGFELVVIHLFCFSVAVVRVLRGLASIPILPQTGVATSVVVVVNVVVVVAGSRQVGAKRVGHRSGDAQVGNQFVSLQTFKIVTMIDLI